MSEIENELNNLKKLFKDDKKAEFITALDNALRKYHNSWEIQEFSARTLYNDSANFPTVEAKELLNTALINIQKATANFEKYMINREDESISESDKTKFLIAEDRINNLENSIKHLIYINNMFINTNKMYEDINSTRKIVYDERTRTIELLGLFVAVMAFIFSSVSIFKEKPLLDSVILVSAMGLILMSFLLGLHMISYEPARTKNVKFILGCFVVILFILPFIPNIINWVNKLVLKLGWFN